MAGKHEEIDYERSDVKVGPVVLLAVGVILFLVVSIILLNDYFVIATERNVKEMVLAPESKQLRELRANEMSILNNYGVVDEKRGYYRIPIDRAMDLMVSESFRDQAGRGAR